MLAIKELGNHQTLKKISSLCGVKLDSAVDVTLDNNLVENLRIKV